MSPDEKLDLGEVQVHKKVLREIVYSAVNDIDGVSLLKQGVINRIFYAVGVGKYSGIRMTVDEKQEVSIEVKVYVRYGLNIPDVAKRVQDSIKAVLEKTVNINLKDIDVNIQGIERGK